MKKKYISFLAVVFCLSLLIDCGCAVPPKQEQYTATYLDLFDTVTTIVGQAESEEAFQDKAEELYEELKYYHQLFDIYNEYDGMNNLKTINDKAGTAPVTVEPQLLELLRDCKEYYKVTGGVFNPAMGSVLSFWHEAREYGLSNPDNAYLPDSKDLEEAGKHINMDMLILDEEQNTVFFADPKMKLDVGAIAKGWAVQKVCEKAPEGILISAGGNVCVTGPKDAKGTPWKVGIQDPADSSDYLYALNITGGSVVTSGSYQRAYTVDGKQYHHIIDPATLYPGELWTSVTVVCEDSGVADMLSTSLFLLEQEAGQELLKKFGAEAMWIDSAGEMYYSSGFQELIQK